ncbi:MAG: DUF4922 domain-containing protein [Magnetococcales bacterium]|nr:DUF4922 domain-containing protein [Magnetococcales bacterium]MBF0149396.1 DUF4922 domain-containing protein [Magnetococcales bacterium]
MTDTYGMAQFNHQRFEALWLALREELDTIFQKDGLVGVIEALKLQQLDGGFIQDDLSGVIKYRIIDEGDPGRYFIVQYNPRRAMRFSGAGRRIPPPGLVAVHGGCFLCRDNIRWQQRGIECGYDVFVDSPKGQNHYIIWMNPFPLMHNHVTVAMANHRPQAWLLSSMERGGLLTRMDEIGHDFLSLLEQMPGYVGFYNGDGAGATIPHHFHFQFFRRMDGQGDFPLERAARRGGEHGLEDGPWLVPDYPITAIHFRGPKERVEAQLLDVVGTWEGMFTDPQVVTANLVGALDPKNREIFDLYFIPRDKTFNRGPGMVGVIAGLELLGEVVYSTEEEKQSLDRGQVNYDFVARIIASVEAPRARELWHALRERWDGGVID